MRRLADADRIDRLLRALGQAAHEETRVCLVGGATMVLNGVRDATVDVPAIDAATFRRAAEEAFGKGPGR